MLVVGGYLGIDFAWRLFEQEWSAFKAEYGIEMFHMTDFASRKRPYTRWPEEKYNRCIAHALDIIDRHSLMRVSCAMKVSDYTSIIKGEGPEQSQPCSGVFARGAGLHEHRRNGDAAMRIY